LFLSADFSRHAQRALTAVARAARCMQVAGGVAAGVFTEQGWALDRPAAAAMVFAGGLALGPPDAVARAAEQDDAAVPRIILSYAGGTPPAEWEAPPSRFGGSFAGRDGRAEPLAWQQARLAAHCSVRPLGVKVDSGVSRGWQLLGEPCPVGACRAYDVLTMAGQASLDHLLHVLPATHRDPETRFLAAVCAVVFDDHDACGAARPDAWQTAFAAGAGRSIAVIAANADRSLTLAERLSPGQKLVWALRSPQAAADDMRRCVDRLAVAAPTPLGAVVFSCIGRGPYFYDGEDRDVAILQGRFPGLPLIGVHGTGQIAAKPAGGNRSLQNAVVTALLSKIPVRPHV
jgi:small ligand-binding sensory domain FIST